MSFHKRHKKVSSSIGGDYVSTTSNQLGSSSESLATLSARLRKISGTVSDADSSQGRYSIVLCLVWLIFEPLHSYVLTYTQTI